MKHEVRAPYDNGTKVIFEKKMFLKKNIMLACMERGNSWFLPYFRISVISIFQFIVLEHSIAPSNNVPRPHICKQIFDEACGSRGSNFIDMKVMEPCSEFHQILI